MSPPDSIDLCTTIDRLAAQDIDVVRVPQTFTSTKFVNLEDVHDDQIAICRLRRDPSLIPRLASEMTRVRSRFVNGSKQLPVEVTLA